MHALYVGTLPPFPGGVAVLYGELLGEFAKRGIRVRALVPLKRGENGRRAGESSLVPYVAYEVPYYETEPYLRPPEELLKAESEGIRGQFSRMVRAERPDVILIGRESFARHVPELARREGVPAVLAAHGNPVLGMLDGSYPEELGQLLLREFRKVDLIVTPARHMSEGLRRLGLPNVETIPNAVDLDPFQPRRKDERLMRELGIDPGDIVAAHVSKLTAVKRPMDIVECARIALKREGRLRFLIVGDGPMREEMEEATADMRMAERFCFTGMVEHRRVADLMNLSDMVIQPSEREGQPLVYLECQACGRLLLASGIPASREVVVDGQTGLLFPRGDVDTMAELVLRAAGSAELRCRIGAKARETAAARAGQDTVEMYISALRSAAGR